MKNLTRFNCCVCGREEKFYKIATAEAFLSVTSNLLLIDYFLQLQIPLSQVLSCFAPIIPSQAESEGERHRQTDRDRDAATIITTIKTIEM